MNESNMKEAENSTLGPVYFSARDIAKRVMDKFEAEQFKPLIDKFSQAVNDKLWSDLEFSLLSDTECNIQGDIWRDVESIVEAILGGEQWVFDRYVLADRVNCELVRATVAKLIPDSVAKKRIEDLEREMSDLKKTLNGDSNRF